MPHAYATNLVHCVFSTKERANLISADQLNRLGGYLYGIAKSEMIELLAFGGIANHVHLLITVPPKLSLSETVQKLKGNSSRWLGPRFAWQQGYGAFSVSPSQVPRVKAYIANQAEHHKARSFEDEFVALLKTCGIEYDPQHVFG